MDVCTNSYTSKPFSFLSHSLSFTFSLCVSAQFGVARYICTAHRLATSCVQQKRKEDASHSPGTGVLVTCKLYIYVHFCACSACDWYRRNKKQRNRAQDKTSTLQIRFVFFFRDAHSLQSCRFGSQVNVGLTGRRMPFSDCVFASFFFLIERHMQPQFTCILHKTLESAAAAYTYIHRE